MNGPALFNLLGGIALLLYGLQLIRNGLEGLAEARLRSILVTATQNRFKGLVTGTFMGAALQSGSAATAMLIGFTSTGLMNLSQSTAVLLGIDLGATLTVQLIAFHILDWSMAIIAIGFFVWFQSRDRRLKSAGLALLGFGFIFLSIKIMTDGSTFFKNSDTILPLMASVGQSPIWAVLLSALLTAFLNSSAATIGILLALAAQDLISLQTAVPLVLGANIGSCAAAWIAGIGTIAESRRVALAQVLFKTLGVVLVFPFLGAFETAAAQSADAVTRQIANAHTLFNLGIAILFLPLTGPVARLVTRLIPDRPDEADPGQPRYLDPRVLDSPALALGHATREALRMSDLVRDMFHDSLRVFVEDSIERLEDIQRRDDHVDRLNREIKLYITKLSGALTEEQSKREVALLALIGDLETIGDIIDRNLMELAKKKIYKGLRFSEGGSREILELHEEIRKNFERAISAFASQDAELARQVITAKEAVTQKERALRAAHIQRLHEGLPESIETSSIHLDVLTNLVRINHHITGIAYPIIDAKQA